MEKFKNIKSIPSYLPLQNIDTDMIIPKQFLKTIKRTGLGRNLFFEMRYDDKGKEINDFILNQSPFNDSKINLRHQRLQMHYQFVMYCYRFFILIYCGGGGNRPPVRIMFSDSIYTLSLF